MKAETKTMLEALARDQVHGANYLAALGLDIFLKFIDENVSCDVAEVERELQKLSEVIQKVRPSMAPVTVAASRAYDEVSRLAKSEKEYDTFVSRAKRRIAAIREDLEGSREQAARNALELFEGKSAVMTLSRSATITRVFELLPVKSIRVWITESRPGSEGIETARALLELGFHVTLVPDMAAATFMNQVDFVVVGADTVLPDGSVVNKSGTSMLALAAKRAGIPLYVVADAFKFSPADRVSLEEKSPDEITRFSHPNLRIRNLYFDRTPADLITGIISS